MHNIESAASVLQAPPPPSLRDIITAYRTRGNGDKDLLLAMLHAKAAEDQRLASLADLHRSMLELYQFDRTADMEGSRNLRINQHNRFSESTLPSPCSTRHPYVKSPHHNIYASSSPKPAFFSSSYTQEPPRKRHRPSASPEPEYRDLERSQAHHPREHLPPSPPSSQSSIGTEASPQPTRSASMAIGSLLRDSTHHTRGESVSVSEPGQTRNSTPQSENQSPSGPS